MKELNLEAKLDNISTLTQNVGSYLEDIGCSVKAQMQIDVAIDEIFSNIIFMDHMMPDMDGIETLHELI